jgi:hypothetical protein
LTISDSISSGAEPGQEILIVKTGKVTSGNWLTPNRPMLIAPKIISMDINIQAKTGRRMEMSDSVITVPTQAERTRRSSVGGKGLPPYKTSPIPVGRHAVPAKRTDSGENEEQILDA